MENKDILYRLLNGRGCVIASIFTTLILLSSSCSTTKNLPEGEVLYTGIKKIEVTDEDKTTAGEDALAEVEGALAYPPNNALLGSSSIRVPLPFGLWVYNAFVNKKGKIAKCLLGSAKPVEGIWLFQRNDFFPGGYQSEKCEESKTHLPGGHEPSLHL